MKGNILIGSCRSTDDGVGNIVHFRMDEVLDVQFHQENGFLVRLKSSPNEEINLYDVLYVDGDFKDIRWADKRPKKCGCADCKFNRELVSDPQLRAMRALLTTKAKGSADRSEIIHYIRQRKVELYDKHILYRKGLKRNGINPAKERRKK